MRLAPTIALSGALLAGLLLWGCGKAQPPGPAPTPEPTPMAEEEAPVPTILRLFIKRDSIPTGILARFTEETGILVEVETYLSNEQMLANLLSGVGIHDLVLAHDPAIDGLIRDNLLLPIVPARIPNLKHLAPEFRSLPFDPDNAFSVPYMAEATGILVRAKDKGRKIRGFEDVFFGIHKGRIVLLDDPREIVSWAFTSLDLPVNEISQARLDQARPLLTKWLGQVKAYDSDTATELLSSGEADLAILPSSTAAELLAENSDFRWILPGKGAHLSVESLCIPVCAVHVPAAEEFINFLLRPEISAEISSTLFRINPNASARAILAQSQEQDQNPATRISLEELARVETFLDIGDQRLQLEELVNTLKTK